MSNNTIRPGLWRRRALTVEAIRYDGSSECLAALEAWTSGRVCWDEDDQTAVVVTARGELALNAGDYVSMGVGGEVRPEQPDNFDASHDPAEVKDYRAFLPAARVLELKHQADRTADPVALREIVAQLVAHSEALQS